MKKWSVVEEARFSRRAVKCPLVSEYVGSLADYLAVLASIFQSEEPFWFRGHGDVGWGLVPSALRYPTEEKRTRALGLVAELRRVAEMKLTRPPADDDEFGWLQVAQHYGLPTRLLDWTENAVVALYFACEAQNVDGAVFMINPVALNRLSYPKTPRILHGRLDRAVIRKYLRLGGEKAKLGLRTIAVNPVWNSERIMLQRGVFTLHGSRDMALLGSTPSLAAVPIPKESKVRLRADLERVGIDEMTIFPELEHACRHLKRRAGLSAIS